MPLQDEILQAMRKAIADRELAGCNLLVLRDGKEWLYAEAGNADIERGTPIRRDSIFRLYSQSKPITAAAVALLVDRGQLDVCRWVQDFLPGFANQQVIDAQGHLTPVERGASVWDLLGMTAGLSYPGDTPASRPVASLFEQNQQAIRQGGGMGTVALCNELGRLPLAFQPGTGYNYSTCADVLGAVVEVVDGRPFSQFLREEFFEPLGMADTGFYVPEEKRDRFVTCYRRTPEGLVPWRDLHLCVGDYTHEPAFASGGAGLVSTLDDYAAFAQMLLAGGEWQGRRILSAQAVRWLTSPQLPPHLAEGFWSNLSGYSYGKLMRHCTDPGRVPGFARLGEYGWDGWLGTYFANLPNEKLTILMNQNTCDTGTAPVTRQVRNLVLREA